MFTLLRSQNLCRSSLPRSFTIRHRRQSLVLAIAAANESWPLTPKTVETQNTKQTLVSWSARSCCALPSLPTTARWPQNRNRAALLWMDVWMDWLFGYLDDLWWTPPGMSLISPFFLICWLRFRCIWQLSPLTRVDGCFCAWNIVNVVGNVFFTIFILFCHLIIWCWVHLATFKAWKHKYKYEVTILIEQNLHLLMQILYLSKLNKMSKNAFKMH
jgi:hypothetical protein